MSARGIAWIRKIFRARENVLRCIAAARKKSGIGVILSEVDDFVVCQLIAIGLSTYLQNPMLTRDQRREGAHEGDAAAGGGTRYAGG